jgi:hypothetical protein
MFSWSEENQNSIIRRMGLPIFQLALEPLKTKHTPGFEREGAKKATFAEGSGPIVGLSFAPLSFTFMLYDTYSMRKSQT